MLRLTLRQRRREGKKRREAPARATAHAAARSANRPARTRGDNKNKRDCRVARHLRATDAEGMLADKIKSQAAVFASFCRWVFCRAKIGALTRPDAL